MPPKKTNERRTENQSAPQPVQADLLDKHISHAEFRADFGTLPYSVATQNKRPAVISANPMANIAAARIQDFTRINPPSFTGSKSDKDPQKFFDQVQKVTDIIGVTVIESVELVAYQLQDVAHSWFKQWKAKKVADVGPIEWEVFATAFLDRFFPLELRETKFCPKSLVPAPSPASAPVLKFRDGNRDRAAGLKPQGSISSARTNPFARNVAETTRVSAGLAVMCVSGVASQVTESNIVPSQVPKWATPKQTLCPQSRQDQESSPDVVTGTLQAYHLHIYALLDPGAFLSFVTPYIAINFRVSPEILAEPFSVSTPMGKSIIAQRFPNEPILEWRDSTSALKGQLISDLRARKMISKGCVYHLIRVQDSRSETTTLESISVACEFPDVFPEDLLRIPSEREINFGIDLLSNTAHIYSAIQNGSSVASAPKKGVAVAAKKKNEKAKVVNPLYEKKPRQFGIGGALPPKKDLSRFVKWPRNVVLQRKKRILKMRLKVPPALNQFTKTLDKNLATTLFKMLLKYRPEDKAAKKERLVKRAQAEAEGKTPETKKPIIVKYGLKHITYLIEQNKAQLVVIAHDVDPIELVVWLPALCRKMEIPYCIVKGKARLGSIVHKKTASALCLTTVKNEDKMEFSRVLEAIKANFNDKYEENRKKWGGGIMGSKSQARTKAKERVLAKEAAQRLN
ncbi:60S ribosomal protein L7a [Capsicum annuum]|nr:60S ribosomal protein L7a [Capsicum annuum]